MAERVRRIPIGERADLPYASKSEAALIGAVLVWPEAWQQVRDQLRPEYFGGAYRMAFEALAGMAGATNHVSDVALVEHLQRLPAFEQPGSAAKWVGETISHSCTPSQLELLTGRVRAAWQRRRAVQLGRELLASALDHESDIEAELTATTNQLRDLASTAAVPTMGMGELLSVGVEVIGDAWQNAQATGGEWIPGYRTGLAAFDRQVYGLHKRQMLVIGARPGMGKSALALDLALGTARHDTPVLYISREDRAEGIALRMLAKETGIEHATMRLGRIEAHDFETIANRAARLQHLPLRFDFGSFSLAQISRSIRNAVENFGAKVVMLDYLQLVRHRSSRYQATQSQEIGEITKGLLEVTMQTDVSLVVFSQLNRDVEKRPDKRPNSADLKDSGDIEQDAHAIAFLYRPAYYWPDKFKTEEAWLLWRKVREGKTGDAPLRWIGSHVKFEDWNAAAMRGEA